MTMQIGLVGSNGIVLASDMKWSTPPPHGGTAVRDGFTASKFRFSPSRNLVVSAAGDMARAIRIAERITAEMDDSDEYTRDRRIYEIGSQVAGDKNVECIIAFLTPSLRLHYFQYLNGGADVVNTPVGEYIHAGDRHNPAIFWTVSSYKAGNTEILKRLAAQVITTAGQINPDGIKGLEIVWSNETGFHLATKDDNDQFFAQAKTLHEQAAQIIYGERILL